MIYSAPRTVIFVDDDEDLRLANVQSLELAGLDVRPYASAIKALAGLDAGFAGVIVTDVRMPRMDGRQFFERIRAVDPGIPVILITGHADVGMAVEAMKDGAYDFVAKPFANERLIRSVLNGLEKRRLVLDNRQLRAIADEAQLGWPIIGGSGQIQSLRRKLRQVAEADVDCLIEGETGVGKELAARALHNWGPRRGRPFVVVDCGALPSTLVESELFGHELGAFPGAVRKRVGRIEHANYGTLFLDEIESLPAEVQVKLLRFLEEREISPLGSNDVHTVSVRVIAAAKPDLAKSASIRPDLYHRLNVANIRVPPLRERRDDIPMLFAHFVSRAAERFGRAPPPPSEAVRRHLNEHDWPGNVRELLHYSERLVLDLDEDIVPAEGETADGLRERVDWFEAELITDTLSANHGDIQQTLRTLRVPRKTLYDKIRRYSIDLSRFRARKG